MNRLGRSQVEAKDQLRFAASCRPGCHKPRQQKQKTNQANAKPERFISLCGRHP